MVAIATLTDRGATTCTELAAAGLMIIDMVEPPTPTAPTAKRDAHWSAWFATLPTRIGLVCAKRRPMNGDHFRRFLLLGSARPTVAEVGFEPTRFQA